MTQSPRAHRLRANGLVHHVLEWSPDERVADIEPHTRRAAVLLLHGFMDAAGTWDLVAPGLARAGHRVLAPDFRGFGLGPRVPSGAYYHFPDYVADLAALVAQLIADAEPLMVVGHSMGGTAATYFAGTLPARVARLAVLEGAGPPDNPVEVGPD